MARGSLRLNPKQRWGQVQRWLALPLVLYSLVALAITFPLVSQITTHIGGAGYGDGTEYVRLGWWFRYALSTGQNPFYQSLFAYPDGFFSAVQWAQPLIYIPTGFLNFITNNPVTAYNIWLLAEIVGSGLTGYWLCAALLHDGYLAATPSEQYAEHHAEEHSRHIAALVGGLVFMAYPAVQGHLSVGHINPLANYALPGISLALYRIVTGTSTRRMAVIGGIALWVMALGNFTFPAFALLPLLLWAAGYVTWRITWRRVRGRVADALPRASVTHALIMLFVGGGLSLPFYTPLAAEILAPNRPAYLQETGTIQYSADLLSFVAPSPFTPWGTAITPPFSRNVLGTNSAEGTAYLGIIAGLLALWAVWRVPRARLWLVLMLICGILSLGPLLKINDRLVTVQVNEFNTYIPLPWAGLQGLPFISSTRTPGRLNLTTGLAVGILAAFGLQQILMRVRRRHWQLGLGLLISGLVLADYQLFWPFPTTVAAIPPALTALAERTEIRAVFDVPFDDLLAQKSALLYQTAHHKPLIAGYVSRRTSVDEAKLTWLSDLLSGRIAGIDSPPTVPQIRALLKLNGIDVVIWHWALLDRERLRGAIELDRLGSTLYQDDQIRIIQIDHQPTDAIPDQTATYVAFSRDGWWSDPQHNDRWLTASGKIFFYTPQAADLRVGLGLAPMPGVDLLDVRMDGQFVQRQRIPAPTEPLSEMLYINLAVEAGFHTLQLDSPDAGLVATIQPSCLLAALGANPLPDQAPRPLAPEACRLTVPTPPLKVALRAYSFNQPLVSPYQRQAIQLGEGLALHGFRVPEFAQAGQRLDIETEWQATQRLGRDYHLFVHIVDSAGALVAQADGIPGAGRFPTTAWANDQRWIEAVQIPLPAGLSAGEYKVFTGWYSLPDGVRLPVQSLSEGAPNGLVYLRSFTVR